MNIKQMENEMTEINLENGKYIIQHTNGTNFKALRHGEDWRDLTGDGLILALCQRIDELQACDELNKARIAELLEIKMELECRIKEIRLEHSKELYKLELENKTLREALFMAKIQGSRKDSNIIIDQALSTPTSTEHLDAYCKSRSVSYETESIYNAISF